MDILLPALCLLAALRAEREGWSVGITLTTGCSALHPIACFKNHPCSDLGKEGWYETCQVTCIGHTWDRSCTCHHHPDGINCTGKPWQPRAGEQVQRCAGAARCQLTCRLFGSTALPVPALGNPTPQRGKSEGQPLLPRFLVTAKSGRSHLCKCLVWGGSSARTVPHRRPRTALFFPWEYL